MSVWCYLVVGVIVSGPLWIAGTLYAARRIWRSLRKRSAKTRGLEHLAEIGQLVGGLAHEIKNPLSTINVNLKLLEEDLAHYTDEDHARLLRRLRSVQTETVRVRGVLEDFLRFAGKHEMTPEVTDLRKLVGELVDFFRPQAQTAKVVTRTSLADSAVCASIDVNLIKQALLNLMLNAVQAMPQGGELLIKVSSNRSQAVLEIIDTGTGIAPENLPKLFRVYFTTKKGGTGLGLATTRRIIREHDGNIHVDSEPGKGTRFTVSLPLAKS